MSLGNCIPGMIARGEIDAARGKRMADRFAELEKHYSRSMSPAAAAAEASEETLRQLAFEAADKKRKTLLSIDAQRRGIADIARFKGDNGYAAIKAMIADNEAAPYQNSERGAQRIEQQVQGRLADFIQANRRNFFGDGRDKAGMIDVVRELHGEATGNANAALFAKAIAQEFEYLRKRFNKAGGSIGKLDGYAMPHAHDTLRVRKAGYAQWRADILAAIDVTKMRDQRTGGALTPEALEDALSSAFANIRSNGITGKAGAGGKMLANQRADHRFFIFKDGQAWLDYNAKYGTGNPFNAIMGHIKGISQDIAMMERFGPNPDATFKALLSAVDGQAAKGEALAPGVLLGTSAARDSAEKLWKFVNGELHIPVIYEGKLSGPLLNGVVTGLAGARQVITSAFLGSATITAIAGDIGTQMLQAGFNGMPKMKIIEGYLRQLNPASAEDRKLAIRLGLGMNDAAHMLSGMNRYLGESHGPAVTAIIADDVLRLSGLNKVTEAGQRAVGMVWLGHLADNRGRSFDALPDDLRAAFDRHGIDAGDWDVMRSAEVVNQGGADFMAYDNIVDVAVSDKMMDMVLSETDMAVKTARAEAQSVLSGGKAGTLMGEISRNLFQFKSFAVNLMLTEGRRLANLQVSDGLAYAAKFAIATTISGYIALQLGEIAKGRDPRPFNRELLVDALLKGGGLGIFGDLIGSYTSEQMGSVQALVAGPVVGLAGDIKTNLVDQIGEDGNLGRGVVKLAKRYTPGQSLWYLRAAFERAIMDNIQQELDPDYYDSWSLMDRRLDDQGQALYWERGALAPSRAPDFANAFEEAPQ